MNKFWAMIFSLTVALAVVACSTPIPATEKVIQLKLSTHHPEQSFLVRGVIAPWAESIEKETNGRVKIKLFADESLVKMKDEYDALVNGLSDIAEIAPGITPDRFPLTEIDTLPMLFPSGEIVGKVHTELLQKYCVSNELGKVKYLFSIPLPPMQFLLQKPVHKLADMKDLKMRIEGKVEGWTMEALGAKGVLISTGEMPASLERGLIDGCALVWEGALAFNVPQVTRYRTKCDIYTRCFPLIMNRDSWNRLPADIKKVFEDNSGPLVAAKYGAAADGAMKGAEQEIIGMDKKAGNPEIYVLSTDEKERWEQALFIVRDKWVASRQMKGLPAREMLDDALLMIKQYTTD